MVPEMQELSEISHKKKTIFSPECFFTGSDYCTTRSNRVKGVYLCQCIATNRKKIDAK